MGHTSYLTNVTTPMNPWTQKQLLEELYRFWKGSNRELAGGSTNAVTAVVEKGFGQQIVISVSQLPATEDSLHNTAYFSDALEKIETMHTPEALFTKPVRNINGDLLVAALEGYLVFATAALQGLTYAQAIEQHISKHDIIQAYGTALADFHTLGALQKDEERIAHPFPPEKWAIAITQLKESALGTQLNATGEVWDYLHTQVSVRSSALMAKLDASPEEYPIVLRHGDIKLENAIFTGHPETKAVQAKLFDYDFVSHGARILEIADFISRCCFDRAAAEQGYWKVDNDLKQAFLNSYTENSYPFTAAETAILEETLEVQAMQWVCHSAYKASFRAQEGSTTAGDEQSMIKYMMRAFPEINTLCQQHPLQQGEKRSLAVMIPLIQSLAIGKLQESMLSK